MPELRTARENARLEIGSQRGRNSHQIGVLGIYDLQGLSYGRTELLVADMRLLEPDPSGSPPAGRCQPVNGHIRRAEKTGAALPPGAAAASRFLRRGFRCFACSPLKKALRLRRGFHLGRWLPPVSGADSCFSSALFKGKRGGPRA